MEDEIDNNNLNRIQYALPPPPPKRNKAKNNKNLCEIKIN